MGGLTAVFWAYLTHCHNWTRAISAVAASSYPVSFCTFSHARDDTSLVSLPRRIRESEERVEEMDE